MAKNSFFVTEEVTSKMVLDRTSSLELELVVDFQAGDNGEWKSTHNKQVIHMHGKAFAAITWVAQPNVLLGLTQGEA